MLHDHLAEPSNRGIPQLWTDPTVFRAVLENQSDHWSKQLREVQRPSVLARHIPTTIDARLHTN